jgi:rhomboid protease GluP
MRSRSAGFTTGMIALCWLFFVLDYISPKTNGLGELTQLGALFPDAVLRGQWWRLITYGFLHANLYHILVNSIALFQAGDFVEYVYGTRRYSVIYIAALIGGGLAAYMATVGQQVYTLGASGAIMGVFGAMIVLAFKLPPLRNELWKAAIVPIILTLGIGFFVPGISNAGHIGGLISGIVAAWIITPVHGREMIRQFGENRMKPVDTVDAVHEGPWGPRRG